jgi:hypothetical protein
MPNRPCRLAEALVILAGSARALAAGPFPASIELSALDGTDGFVLNGIAVNDISGFSVSSAGDVNGDGVDDVIIGAFVADPSGRTSAGESYVVFGGPAVGAGGSLDLSSLDGTNGFVINGIDANDNSGVSVSSAGDVNGDGVDDVIIGAYRADPNGRTNAGESYVVFGGPGVGAGGSLDLSSLSGANGFVLNGIETPDRSGFSVSSAGDVNGDGVDDLIIGAYWAFQNGQVRGGESYVVFGGPGVGAGGSLELSSLDGTNGFVLSGSAGNEFSGFSVSSAGDVNGDGVDDVVIAAPGANENYVVFGGPGPFPATTVLNTLNGTDGFVVNGIDGGGSVSSSVSSAGDVNGDGVDDVIIGAPGANENYVVFGGPGVGAGGSLDLSSLDGTNGFVLNGIDAGGLGSRSVSAAGDVNGDGVDDVIIGARYADPNGQSNAGESYVVFGGPFVGASGSVVLSSLNGANGFVLNGIDAGDSSGFSVSSAGDVNGDGVDDVIIGARYADPNGQSNAGESYVVFGRPSRGACCLDAAFCVEALESSCADIGGVFAGVGTGCAITACPGCVGDINRDGATDVFDFAEFADDFGCGTR